MDGAFACSLLSESLGCGKLFSSEIAHLLGLGSNVSDCCLALASPL